MGAMTVTTNTIVRSFPAKFLKAAGWQPIWPDRRESWVFPRQGESFVPFPAKFLKAAGWQSIWPDRHQRHQS